VNPTGIEWCTIKDQAGEILKRGYTCNPIVGCTARCGATAEHPEGWCYARRIATTRLGGSCKHFPDLENNPAHRHAGLDPDVSLCGQFFPHQHSDRLEDMHPRTKARGIFIGSMTDMWDPYVHPRWRDTIFDEIYCANPEQQPEAYRFDTARNTYWTLTKRPDLIGHTLGDDEWWFENIDNLWVGVSVTCGDDVWRIDELIEGVPERRFVSFEPLTGPIGLEPGHQELLDWIIVGGMTGPGAIPPEAGWVEQLVDSASARDVPVFVKDNLINTMGEQWVRERQQHPAAMKL